MGACMVQESEKEREKRRKKRGHNHLNYAGNSAECSFQGAHALMCAWDRKRWSVVLLVSLS